MNKINKKFYSLEHSTESKIIGRDYPQIQGFIPTYDENASDNIYKIPMFKIPEFIPNLDGLKLHNRAKRTDILSCSMFFRGKVINAKVKEILNEYSIVKHKYFPMKIYDKNEILTDYDVLICEFDILENIDFVQTAFYERKNNGEFYDRVEINDAESYYLAFDKVKNKTSRMYEFMLENKGPIYLKPDFPIEIDYFDGLLFFARPIISEQLKIALEEANVTGVYFKELSAKLIFQ